MHLVLVLCLLLLGGCARLPSLDGRTDSVAVAGTQDTVLGATVQPLARAHPGLSGVVLLADGRAAFTTRMAVVAAAQRSLDLQYYIWRNDATGSALFDALRRAADRGVRVRLLLDDNNTAAIQHVLRRLDAHPGIEVRLFNPFAHRRFRALDFLADFDRVNRRMHNKALTADNQVSIVGGRNIGDEYFGGEAGTVFVDLDVLAIGAVVPDVSRDFDRYWASASSYPLATLVDEPEPRGTGSEASGGTAAPAADAPAQPDAFRALLAPDGPLAWARVTMVSDDPAKGLGRAAADDLLWSKLQAVVPAASTQVQLVSAYFVPHGRGAGLLLQLAHRGVRVSVLTNALEATDVPAVHAGYAAWRRRLLEAGIELFELKRSSAQPAGAGSAPGGSSNASLHAKTFVVDRRHLFVGSFNFDPRSAILNTELGFVIDSPVLAAAVSDRLAARLPTAAYRLQLRGGRIEWQEHGAHGLRLYDQEPHAGLGLRLKVWLVSLLPVGELL